jgi:serine/arginine repetitive matrix protein 1
MAKVKLDVMKPWITKRLSELLDFEDDVVIEFVFNQLEEKVVLCSRLTNRY